MRRIPEVVDSDESVLRVQGAGLALLGSTECGRHTGKSQSGKTKFKGTGLKTRHYHGFSNESFCGWEWSWRCGGAGVADGGGEVGFEVIVAEAFGAVDDFSFAIQDYYCGERGYS